MAPGGEGTGGRAGQGTFEGTLSGVHARSLACTQGAAAKWGLRLPAAPAALCKGAARTLTVLDQGKVAQLLRQRRGRLFRGLLRRRWGRRGCGLGLGPSCSGSCSLLAALAGCRFDGPAIAIWLLLLPHCLVWSRLASRSGWACLVNAAAGLVAKPMCRPRPFLWLLLLLVGSMGLLAGTSVAVGGVACWLRLGGCRWALAAGRIQAAEQRQAEQRHC